MPPGFMRGSARPPFMQPPFGWPGPGGDMNNYYGYNQQQEESGKSTNLHAGISFYSKITGERRRNENEIEKSANSPKNRSSRGILFTI